jgi:hypothetical protein
MECLLKNLNWAPLAMQNLCQHRIKPQVLVISGFYGEISHKYQTLAAQ